jgi:hypothetical protein
MMTVWHYLPLAMSVGLIIVVIGSTIYDNFRGQ